MTGEQEKAIDDLRFFYQGEYITREMEESAKVVLEMLEEKDKEIEELEKQIELMAKDKYENLNVEQMADIGHEIGYDLEKLFSGIPDEEVLNIIKQYFENKAKGE